MQLDTAQNRIVRSKPLQASLLRGVKGTGKTTAAVYRTLYLKNNYCLYDDDKILILTKDSTDRDRVRHLFNAVEDETRYDFKTLLTNNIERVEILTVEEIINRYYFIYTNSCKKWYKIIQSDSEKLIFIYEALKEARGQYGEIKLLKDENAEFLKDEIAFIKSCGIANREAYQNADRIGRRCIKGQGPSRLLKNSNTREIIYKLLNIYSNKLTEQGIIDSEDITRIAIKQVSKASGNKFTHIIVDGAQSITKAQLDFIKKLSNNRRYSTTTFIIDRIDFLDFKSWFSKRRKLVDLDLGSKVKTYRLLKSYIDIPTEKSDVKTCSKSSIELYEYLDLKHKKRFEFKRDADIPHELILNSLLEETVLKDKEIRVLPLCSEIAAGEPIMMSSETEGEFYLPEYWLKGSDNCFMLKVRGDSMIGADIFDGDFVVIKKQSTALKGDIVAVDLDGSATLKRLSMKNNVAFLMPENEKYEPIFLHDKEVSILGIAVGVIKNR